MAVHRLRLRYRELLREEIAHTVADPSEIEDELRLFAYGAETVRGVILLSLRASVTL